MPWPEIQAKFRKSELVLLGWRSREKAAQWEKKMKKHQPQTASGQAAVVPLLRNVPEYCDETGVPDMRKMTGQQQLAHLASLGFPVPFVMPVIKDQKNA